MVLVNIMTGRSVGLVGGSAADGGSAGLAVLYSSSGVGYGTSSLGFRSLKILN